MQIIKVKAMLEIKNLSVGIEDKKILEDINIKVGSGETYMIFGPNGSGKTTLLRAILGYPKYDVLNGKIELNGKELTTLPIDKRVKLGLGMGFQHPPEIKGITLLDMLKICEGKGPEDDLSNDAKNLIKKLNMSDFLERDVNRGFSGGERKRSEVLQLLLMKPHLMLLDEPDSGVDVESLALIGKTINDYIKKEDASAMIVTHQGKVMDYIAASHACVLIGGKSYCYKGPKGIMKDIEERGYRACVNCPLRKEDDNCGT